MTTPTIAVESISPTKAGKLLATNTNNRTLRPSRVKQYAVQMERGQWQMVGDPIRIDRNGVLIDGQHRLQAVVMSGKTLQFVVIRGLDPESFVVLDSGLGRTAGDSLGNDVTASSHKAAAVRMLYVMELDGDPRKSDDRNAITRQDIHEYYTQHAAEVDDGYSHGSSIYNIAGGNRTAWIALSVLTGRVDSDLRNKFFYAIRTGAGLGTGDPRLALRNWVSQKANKKGSSAGDHMMLYVKAWNDWMKGSTRTIMRLSADEPFPAIVTTTKLALL